MPTYRNDLPMLDADLMLTDGGLETTLIFDQGIDLADFAAFPLLDDEAGRQALRRYFDDYARLAVRDRRGIVLETPTWRASADWGQRLGYDAAALAEANRDAVALLIELRLRHATTSTPVVVSGNLGPRGDGYAVTATMSVEQAQAYHAAQIESFADSEADLVTALTLTYVEEAIGIARCARAAGLPVVLSFTVGTDGRLPSGTPLGDAIDQVDAATEAFPSYYMINCAHPTHFLGALDGAWTARVRGVRANASRRSHAELDEAATLDRGDPDDLAAGYVEVRAALPQLTVVGGCCGTDRRHVEAISAALSRG